MTCILVADGQPTKKHGLRLLSSQGGNLFSYISYAKIINCVGLLWFGLLLLYPLSIYGNKHISTAAGWGSMEFRSDEISYYRYLGEIGTCQVDFQYMPVSHIVAQVSLMINRAWLLPRLNHPEFYDFHHLSFYLQDISTGVGYETGVSEKITISAHLGAQAQWVLLRKKFNSRLYDDVVENKLQYDFYSLFIAMRAEYHFWKNIFGTKIRLFSASWVRRSDEPFRVFLFASRSWMIFFRHEWEKREIEFFFENRTSDFPYRAVIYQVGINMLWKF